MTASVRIGSRWSKDYGKDTCCPRCCFFVAAVLTVVLQRFSEEPAILAELVQLKEPPTSLGPEPAMDYVRRAVWGMLYAYTADDGANRSGRANVQTGAILHLPRGRRDRNPEYIR